MDSGLRYVRNQVKIFRIKIIDNNCWCKGNNFQKLLINLCDNNWLQSQVDECDSKAEQK